MLVKGLIHIYCGNGKGKTTAALGLGIRAFGRGLHVVFAQFLKDGNSGEIEVLASLGENFTIVPGKNTTKFIDDMTKEEIEQTAKEQRKKLNDAQRIARESNCDLLILDEIIDATNLKMIDIVELIKFIENKPDKLEIVLTGRNPDASLIKIADYVSEVKKIKHPYDEGIPCRKGIEL